MHKTEVPSVVLIFLGVELHGHAENGGTVIQGKLAVPEERSKIAGYAPKGSCYPAATCMLCGEARAVLSPENDRSVHHGERNALHD